MIKTFIKQFLSIFGWRLVKILYPPKYPSEKISKELVNAMLDSKNIIHIGAHRGTEAPVYAWFNKSVIWVEPNKEIFDELKINLRFYDNQKALNYLILNENKQVDFFISNNDGASSSIFDFGEKHQDSKLFNNRKFKYIYKKKLNSISFDFMIEKEKINIFNYNFWVIDVQGAELLVLKGSNKNLDKCKYLYIEISKAEFYKDGAQYLDIKDYLLSRNFVNLTNPSSDHDNVLFKNLSFKTT